MTQRFLGTLATLACLLAVVVLAACAAPTATPTFTPLPATPTPAPTPTPTPVPPESVVVVGTARFVVEVAESAEERAQGLSGRSGLSPGTGMLFVFDREDWFVFWMKEMQFPLDFVWISADCAAADLTESVPPPEPKVNLSDLPRYQPDVPVQYVLEVNAGVIAREGITEGDEVAFEGTLEGKYGC